MSDEKQKAATLDLIADLYTQVRMITEQNQQTMGIIGKIAQLVGVPDGASVDKVIERVSEIAQAVIPEKKATNDK